MTAGESAGSVNYGRLARDTASARQLPRAERAVLTALGQRANRRGRCWPSVGLIAEDAGYSVSAAKRALAGLEAKQLIRSRRRGCQSAIRQLCLDAPMPAPPCPCGTQPLFDMHLQPAASELVETFVLPAPAAPLAPVEVSSSAVEVSPDPPRSTHQKEGDTKVNAHEHLAEDLPAPAVVLEAKLDDVLAVLQTAPGVVIERYAVHAALAAHPEAAGHDHTAAAWAVARRAHERNLRSQVASTALWWALVEQTQGQRGRGGASSGYGHENRARRAPAAPGVKRFTRQD